MPILELKDSVIQRILAFDLEWSLDKDKYGEHPILAAGFADTDGYTHVILNQNDERTFLKRILKVIERYDWSMGFYSTGVRVYNPLKHKFVGRDSDLIQLHKRLERFHIDSPIYVSDNTGIPYLTGENRNHSHIDIFKIFANQIVRTSVYKNVYNSYQLDTISKAILGNVELKNNWGTFIGKYKGLSGTMFETLSDTEKEEYVLQDALLVKYLVSNNKYEILKVMKSLSDLTGLSFLTICNSKGVTKIWTPILDTLTEKEINNLGNTNEYDVTRCDRLLSYYDHKIVYGDQNKIGQEQQELEDTTFNEIDDPDQEEENEIESVKPDDIISVSNTNKKSDVRYIGGWVMTPNPGEYHDVTVFDITSLYPTMIVNNNISFETINCLCCIDNPNAKVQDYVFDNIKANRHICQRYTGVLTRQIVEYMKKRIEYKKLAKKLVNDNDFTNHQEQIEAYEIISNAYKILINSAYGQLGHKFAKYENVMAAELVTRYGRATIQYCFKIAKEIFKWNVIYGDTDSLFIDNSKGISDQDIQAFKEMCKKQVNVEMDTEIFYEKLVITGSKNYVGITGDSKNIIIKGLGGKKSDRCQWVRNSFTEMLNDYRDGINPCIKLRQEINKMQNNQLDNSQSQLIIFKNINKNVEDYKTNVIQKLIGQEKHLDEGDTVRYYMADNPKKYSFNHNDYSKKEYKKQLINTVKPILSVLNYNVTRELERSATIEIMKIDPLQSMSKARLKRYQDKHNQRCLLIQI